ncbi:MAG: hypothetical protein M1816_004611 [Peltula sp. TS41687]|nr:MAG: hypothetical protein M1816_004611 [Peltula sp. TS41687]
MSHQTFTVDVLAIEITKAEYEDVSRSDNDSQHEEIVRDPVSELTMEAYHSYRLQPSFHYPTTQELKDMDVADLMQFIVTAEMIDDKTLNLTIAESKARDIVKKKQPSSQPFFNMSHARSTGPRLGVIDPSSSRIPQELQELQRSIRPLKPGEILGGYVKDTTLNEMDAQEAHEQEEFEKFGTMDTLATPYAM